MLGDHGVRGGIADEGEGAASSGSRKDDDATCAWEREGPPLLQILSTAELGGGRAPEMGTESKSSTAERER